MNLLNENTLYQFEITYKSGYKATMANARISDIEQMAQSSYYFPKAHVESGVDSIRLIGEAQALNDSYWSGFGKAKEMAPSNVRSGFWK